MNLIINEPPNYRDRFSSDEKQKASAALTAITSAIEVVQIHSPYCALFFQSRAPQANREPSNQTQKEKAFENALSMFQEEFNRPTGPR